MKELIHEFKYKGKERLAKPLSGIMISFIKEYAIPIQYLDMIIPMPLHRTRLREREFNQAQVLSRQIAEEFDKEIADSLLLRNRLTRSQTELPTQERFKNALNSFSTAKGACLNNKNLLIVDDVLTTGATSSEAALALKKAGANKILVLTLAS
jgi:ComF family protein